MADESAIHPSDSHSEKADTAHGLLQATGTVAVAKNEKEADRPTREDAVHPTGAE